MTSENRALVRTFVLVASSLVAAILIAFVVPRYVLTLSRPPRTPLVIVLQVKAVLSTFTSLMLLVLLVTYARIYRDLPNRFTLSLLLFTVSLTLYAITANPLVALLFGFFPPVGLGPFTFLPDVFASVAVIALLYQSYT